LEQEYDINFLYIDLTKDIDEDKLKQIKLLTKGKPAVIIGCNVFLGSQTIETYRNALDEINR
ncbi:MAG: hypothetical protein J7K26_00275, partial [Candidatus Aenigmarchaeota archaeon]|nr:hypothetical protein [Candidatus Aenigmarchaeota archaeon]